MSLITQYELLKINGTWKQRVQYILSLTDKILMEQYLKQSQSYDDLQMLIYLSKLTKNDENLLEIFKNDSYPLQQRAKAGISWLRTQQNEKQIYTFIVETVTSQNTSRFLKQQVLRNLRRNDSLKKSTSFFYDLACCLMETFPHGQFDIDAHLIPFCSNDQIVDLLSRWSIENFEQIDISSLFYSKLIRYRPHVLINFVEHDLMNARKVDNKKILTYFRENDRFLSILATKEPKSILRLIIEFIDTLDKCRRFLPYFVQAKQKYLFKKAPNEMIELITIVASTEPGTIKYQTPWGDDGYELDAFCFPRTFSLEHYARLFFVIYDKCQWSLKHTIRLCQYMLQHSKQHVGLSSCRKRRKWLYEIVINRYIGKELFHEILIREGNEATLELFEEYVEITTPLSLHLINRYEASKRLRAKQRLSLICYQSMTKEIFDTLLVLFSQTNSNIRQRQQNYILLLQCAVSSNTDQIKNILHWIHKRLSNERIDVIEAFLQSLFRYNNRFPLEILPNNFESIDGIIQLALNHHLKSSNTLEIVINYGLRLLECAEYHPNDEKREQVQTFARKLIKECFSKHAAHQLYVQPIPEWFPKARHIVADILIEDLYSKYLSKYMLNELNDSLNCYLKKPWLLPQIDLFIKTFFFDVLPFSEKLQTLFRIDVHSTMISLFLKRRSTKFDRVYQLINNIDKIFILNDTVQQVALQSQQYQPFIDELLEDNNCATVDKLPTKLQMKTTKNIKLPGLHINVLNSSVKYLTGIQQERITNIILNSFITDPDVENPMKSKSLRLLRCFFHTYNESLHWLAEKQISPLIFDHRTGINIQPLDHLVICLPIQFDLTSTDFLKQFHYLKMKLNASNAKYISDAMLRISRRIPTNIFLQYYVEFIRSEHFQTLGITANKEILRLLNEYTSDSSLIESVIKQFWDSRPHPDVRTCLILTLLNFAHKLHSTNGMPIMWQILDEAATDDYLPLIETLFSSRAESSRWSLSRSTNSLNDLFQNFIGQIQFKVLDHPTSLEARLYAWSHINIEYCDSQAIIDKIKRLCVDFNKDANVLWETAFQTLILLYKRKQPLLPDPIADIIQNLMSRRDEIDSYDNAINNEHDLPVYHRLHRILTSMSSHVNEFNVEKQLVVRSLVPKVLHFDKTLAITLGTLLIKMAQDMNDLTSMLSLLQQNLPENYYENVTIRLAMILFKKSSCSFMKSLDSEEKLDLARRFIEEKHQELFAFDFLKNYVFNQSKIDREQCQTLLRLLRRSDNLFLKQRALEYNVSWKKNKEKYQRQYYYKSDDTKNTSGSNNSEVEFFQLFE